MSFNFNDTDPASPGSAQDRDWQTQLYERSMPKSVISSAESKALLLGIGSWAKSTIMPGGVNEKAKSSSRHEKLAFKEVKDEHNDLCKSETSSSDTHIILIICTQLSIPSPFRLVWRDSWDKIAKRILGSASEVLAKHPRLWHKRLGITAIRAG
jgi:hypothetical protein